MTRSLPVRTTTGWGQITQAQAGPVLPSPTRSAHALLTPSSPGGRGHAPHFPEEEAEALRHLVITQDRKRPSWARSADQSSEARTFSTGPRPACLLSLLPTGDPRAGSEQRPQVLAGHPQAPPFYSALEPPWHSLPRGSLPLCFPQPCSFPGHPSKGQTLHHGGKGEPALPCMPLGESLLHPGYTQSCPRGGHRQGPRPLLPAAASLTFHLTSLPPSPHLHLLSLSFWVGPLSECPSGLP